MKNTLKTLLFTFSLMLLSNVASAQMEKEDLESAFAKISIKTHSHFNLVHDNNVDKFAMEEDFSLEFKEKALIIHNGLNEIHVSYEAIKYVSVGKPDKAHSELKGQWFIIF
ncbi:MAG: hypothetical protein MK078_14725 [Crocinitomicaceae bacterium]|nr:hypothetical protein [Crocinitomicaceae bacterium]